MSDRIVARLGAASGVPYALAILGGSLFSGDTGKRVELVGMLLFLPFLGYLSGVLRRAEGADGWLSTTALVSGLAAITIKLASAAPLLVADREAKGTRLHDALVNINDASFVLTMLPLAVLAAAAATVTLRTCVLPRWLGWLAAVTAPALVANGLFFRSENGPAFLMFLLWLVATSVVLTLRAAAGPVAAVDRRPLAA